MAAALISRRLSLAAVCALVLAGCASTGQYESRPSPKMPGQGPAVPPVVSAPPVAVPPATSTTPPARPPVAVPAPPVVPNEREVRALVERLLPAGIPGRAGWAGDITTAFVALRLAPSRENVCAAMAVIEQESTWQADPVVPGLPKLVRKELEARRVRYGIPSLVMEAALLKTSPDGRSYSARIDSLKTEKQVNDLFEDMVAEIPKGKEWFGDMNPVRTAGPMQVSIAFANDHAREKPYPYGRVAGDMRREVFTRRGGVYFGIANLLDYPADYSHYIYRFADFNAGRYSSRNAAFQHAVARLSGRSLDLDGDLLRYDKDRTPSNTPSATLQALDVLTSRLNMRLTEVVRDLKLEKTYGFAHTPVYQRVFALADQTGGGFPRETLPRIDLKSPKIQRKLTTEWFARRVDGRFRTCLERAPAGPVVVPPGSV